MSRSYKKYPYCGDKKGQNKKRFSWKKVRQWLKDNPEELPQKNFYKKIYPTWDICDFYWTYTWEEYWKSCQKWHQEASQRGWGSYCKELNEKEEYRFWYTHYKRK